MKLGIVGFPVLHDFYRAVETRRELNKIAGRSGMQSRGIYDNNCFTCHILFLINKDFCLKDLTDRSLYVWHSISTFTAASR